VNSKQLLNLRNLESGVIPALHPYLFRAFGINIASDIFLPELETTEGVPDVRIVLGKTPQGIQEPLARQDSYQAAPGQFLLHVAQVGHYYVAGGNRIVIDPDHSAEPGTVRLFLLGTAFGALLLQRGVLPIHGSTVVIKGQALIITGFCGAGKSTLLAALRLRGAHFLTDDVAAVTTDDGNVPWVQPGYPQQKLWKDSADSMGMDVSDLPAILPGMEKYAIAAERGFCRRPVPLAAVCELQAEERPEAAMVRLAGSSRIAVLLGHTYRNNLVAGFGLKAGHFERCASVAKQISVCRLLRPSGKFSLSEQAQLVEGLMTRQLAQNRAGGTY
jgi:hypothetical protein